MTHRAVVILAFLIAIPVGYLGYSALESYYLAPREQIRENIETHTSNLALIRSEREDTPRVHDELQAIVDRTLGPDFETVDHRLLSRLNRIGEDIGLVNLSVSTGEVNAHTSPAADDIPRAMKDLRSEIDFVVLNGFISGDATYGQAIELIARLRAEPWIKRLFYVRLDPKNDGEVFRVQVHLTTLFLPGESPGAPLPDEAPPLNRERLARLTASNPFVLPKPAPVEQTPAVVAEAPPPEPGFPYENWVMTGIVTGPDGAEVWLVESGSLNTALLTPGEALSEMTLVAATGERAEFEMDGTRIHVAVGQSLGEGIEQATTLGKAQGNEAARQ